MEGHENGGETVLHMSQPLPEISTERLTLKMLNPTFAPHVADYFLRNRSFAAPWNPLVDEAFYTATWQASRLQHDLEEYRAGRMVRFWLFLRDDVAYTRVIGHIALSNIVRGALQGCFVGYMVDEAEGNKGLITEGMRGVIAYAFDELLLHRLEANIMPRNQRSIKVAEKLGFQREGLSPKYLRINGVWEDHYRYGLVNHT
jgi:ribosomal-protein-alanine N-acetyltransferase